jgi:hypothetical protein
MRFDTVKWGMKNVAIGDDHLFQGRSAILQEVLEMRARLHLMEIFHILQSPPDHHDEAITVDSAGLCRAGRVLDNRLKHAPSAQS